MKATGAVVVVVAVVLLSVGVVFSQADQISGQKSCSNAPATGGNGGAGGAGGAGGSAVADNGTNATPGSPGSPGAAGTPGSGANGGNGGTGGAGGDAIAGNGTNATPGSPGTPGTPGSGTNGGNGGAGGAGGAGGNALGGNCPAQVVVIQGGEQLPSSTFTLTVQAARRYAVQALERARPNGRPSRLTCSQNSRNRFICRLKWTLQRVSYQATLNVRYRTRSPRVAWQGRMISIR